MPHESLHWQYGERTRIIYRLECLYCQKMAMKIKEIEPPNSAHCMYSFTHVIVVHSMKLMIRPTVDLLLWFFNNPTESSQSSHSHTQTLVFEIHSQKAPLCQCCGSVSLLWLKQRSRHSLNCRAERVLLIYYILYVVGIISSDSDDVDCNCSAISDDADVNCDADCDFDSDYVRSGQREPHMSTYCNWNS